MNICHVIIKFTLQLLGAGTSQGAWPQSFYSALPFQNPETATVCSIRAGQSLVLWTVGW